MKRTVKRILLICLAAVMAFAAFGCARKDVPATEQGRLNILPAFDRETYFFGGCELASEVGTSGDWRDEGTTIDWTTSTAGAMGVKSERVWLRFPTIIKRAEKSNELSLIRDECDRYHEYLAKLKANGVERILLMCSSFLYPYNFKNGTAQCVPDPLKDPDIYKEWMDMVYESYRMIAEEFPEVKYFESGNEYDLSDFLHKSEFATDKSALYTATEAAWITADIAYTANKAIKSVNKYNVNVMAGMSQYATVTYFESVYEAIESKRLPTIEDHYVTDPDDYFDVIAWHNYPIKVRFGTDLDKLLADFSATCEARYEVAKKHGDGDKRVWITEIGISDDNIYDIIPGIGEEDELEKLSEYAIKMLQAVKDGMPYVETVFWFRYADMYSGAIGTAEDHYGLFYSADDPVHHGAPKPVALAMYKWVHGEDADTSGLYWYCSKFGIEE